MRRKTVRHWLVVGGTTLLGVATSLAATVPGTSTASAGTSKGPIVVGGVIEGADYPGAADGFAARIDRFNKAGGIDGRKIDFIGTQDDGSDPSRNQTLIEQLVEADHVDVVAPLVSQVFTQGGATFLQQHQTPYIGWGVTPAWCGSSNDYAFSIDGCVVPANGQVSLAAPDMLAKYLAPKKPSKTTVAIVNNDDPTASSAEATEGAFFKKAGFKVVFNKGIVPVGGTATNYAPYVEEIEASHPDVVFVSLDFASSTGLSAAFLEAGYKGVLYSPTGYSEGILQSQPSVKAALQGQLVYNELPATEDDSPAIKQVTADLKSIGKGDEPIGLGLTLGYYDADLLIQMLQNAAKKGQPLTGAGIAKAADSGFTYEQTAKGGACSERFPAAEQVGTVGATLMQVDGSRYKLKLPYACYPNVDASS